jgi:hypothetical protein
MRHRLGLTLVVVMLALTGCGGSAASPGIALAPSASPHASTSAGLYGLDLQLTKLAWKVGEPMTGTATLSYAGGSHVNLDGSGTGLISFNYAEVGGNRKLEGVWTADCGPHDIGPASPITTPLTKDFGYQPDSGDDAWIKAILDGDGIQLPAGTWDITARAVFVEGKDCSGATYNIETTVRVTVGG